MLKKIIYLFIFCFLTATITAQKTFDRKTLRDANYYLKTYQYDKALKKFLSLYDFDNNNSTLNYLIGKCYFNLAKQKEDSKPYLLKASKSVSPHYKLNDLDKGNAAPDTYLMLGELFHFDNELDSALYFYIKYDKIVTTEKEKQLAKNRIKSISTAEKLLQLHLPYTAKSLGPEINSGYSDYSPVFSTNEETMAFTSFRENKDEIYVSNKTLGKWGDLVNITRQIGSKGNCFTAAMSANGNKIYLLRINEFDSNIFYTEFDGRKWSKMKSFDVQINNIGFKTSFYINDIGDKIYFSSDAPGGIGGLDIYYSQKNAKGKWEYPTNLGSRINTPYDETSPFLARNGNILFFSSNGHETMGGYDIFFSEKIGGDVWSKPVNAGYPLNTTSNDLSFVALDQGNRGYIVKDLPGGYGLLDIYEIDVPPKLFFADKLFIDPNDKTAFDLKPVTIEPAPQNKSEDSFIPNTIIRTNRKKNKKRR